MGFTCHMVSAILLSYLLYISLHNYDRIHKTDVFIPVFNAALIVASVIADSFYSDPESPITYLTSERL